MRGEDGKSSPRALEGITIMDVISIHELHHPQSVTYFNHFSLIDNAKDCYSSSHH